MSEIEASGTYKPTPPDTTIPVSMDSPVARYGDSDDKRSIAATESADPNEAIVVDKLKELYGVH